MKQLLLTCFLLGAFNAFAQNTPSSEEVKKVASLKVQEFLALIPGGREKDYGFETRADFELVSVEQPYEVYYVTYLNNQMGLLAAAEWRVPLSVKGKFISLITVRLNNGTLEAVDFGGNILAEKIQAFENLPAAKEKDHVLVRNTFLQRDFLTSGFKNSQGILSQNLNEALHESSPILYYMIGEDVSAPITAKGFSEITLFRINNPMSK